LLSFLHLNRHLVYSRLLMSLWIIY